MLVKVLGMAYLRLRLVYIVMADLIGLAVALAPGALPMVWLPASSTPIVIPVASASTSHCALSYPPAQFNPLAPVRRAVGWLANPLAALNRQHRTTSGLLGLRSHGIGFAAGL